MNYALHSLAWDNVAPSIVLAQRRVADHFHLPLLQWRENTHHGTWIDRIMSETEDDVVGFFDVDAVPTNAQIVSRVVNYAHENNAMVGIAQTSNHLDKWHIYAGPAFFVISRAAWIAMNRPSFCETHNSDVGQNITRIAESINIPYRCLYPTHWEVESTEGVWGLGNYGKFAVGTHYRGGIYHLFQGSITRNAELFSTRCADIISGTFSTAGMRSVFDDQF